MILYSIFLIVQLVFGIFILYLTIAFITGAPFVPSTKVGAQTMIHLARIKKDDVVYDLGSGDGRLLLLAMQAGARRAVGYEINPFLVLYSRLCVFSSPYRHQIKIYLKNFWSASITDANVVFVYLLPWRMKALAHKLSNELRPGTRIVSNSFIFPGQKILRKDVKNHIYVFTTPFDSRTKKTTISL